MSLIKSFSVGSGEIKGDTFYIKHNTDNFTIIDCCLEDSDREKIVDEIIRQANDKKITRFISTHPDEDHIQQLEYLDDRMKIINFYCVENKATKESPSDSFKRYCELRDSDKAYFIYKGGIRKWMNQSDKERGSSGLSILWPNIENKDFQEELNKVQIGQSPNNISPIIRYSLKNGVKVLWMGDLETDFMTKINEELEDVNADILFAPHHGRNSGKVPKELLEKINPKIIIIGEAPSKHLNYYQSYNTITQNSAGDIVLDCIEGKVNLYVSKEYSVDFLVSEKDVSLIKKIEDMKYIGSLLI